MTATIGADGFCTRCGEVADWCQCPPLPDDAGAAPWSGDDADVPLAVGADGGGALAWFKAKITEAGARGDPDRVPGTAARLIEVMARNGMDTATRASLRAYVKTHRLITAAEFDRITLRRKPILRTVTPLRDVHTCTPPGWARTDQDILRRMVVCTRVCMGLIGENRAAKLTYLAITSRLLGEPVNIAVKGLSSSGKSYTVECVIRLFPDEAVYTMTAMSERALIYLDEPLKHRTVVLFEAAALRENREKDGDMAAYIVRSLLSEGRIEYPVVIRDEDTGQLHTEKLVIEGPTNLITTTTAVSLHGENETRLLSVPSNDSKEQTRAVMITSAEEKKRAGADLADWHDLQRWLAADGRRDVVIPYAACVAWQIPPEAVRLRRDWNAVRSLIRAHALIHQLNRDTDGQGRIVAALEDYTAVRSLTGDLIAEAIGATVRPTVRETVGAVAEAEALSKDGYATVHDVARHLELERSAAQRRLNTARDKGYVVNIEDKKGRPARYVIGETLPGDVIVLPDPGHVCTGPCTHARNGETAGQHCDCTGVCRCADDADPTQGETYTGRDQP